MKLRWRNFRSFPDTRWFEFKPLTILIGPNNTGKTSLYEPLLLLNQSLHSRRSYPALVTKGDLINSGTYEDVVFNHELNSKIHFQFADLAVSADMPGRLADRLARFVPASVRLTFRPSDERREIELDQYSVYGPDGTVLVSRRRMKNGRYSLGAWPRPPRIAMGKLRPIEKELIETWRRIPINDQPENFRFAPRTIASLLNVTELTSPQAGKARRLAEWMIDYLLLNLAVAESLDGFVRRLSYLGPLRALAERRYELSGEMPTSVGRGGAFAPEILFRLADSPFLKVVKHWLEDFGFPGDIDFRSADDPSTFSLFFRRGSDAPWINFADCGIGLSQLLPLIIQGFHAPNEGVVVVEQPEIHLNPRLQAHLADLFVEIAKRVRNVIIETHSEHLLLRLRRLVAENRMRSDDLALYFTQQDHGRSTVRRISIDNEGRIARSEWPTGFFEESLTESLALVAAQSRSQASVK